MSTIRGSKKLEASRIWSSDYSLRILDPFSKHSTQDSDQKRISPVDSNKADISLLCVLYILLLLPWSHTILHVCDCESVSCTGLWAPYGQARCLTCSFVSSTSHSTWNVTGTQYLFPESSHIPWHHRILLSKRDMSKQSRNRHPSCQASHCLISQPWILFPWDAWQRSQKANCTQHPEAGFCPLSKATLSLSH